MVPFIVRVCLWCEAGDEPSGSGVAMGGPA